MAADSGPTHHRGPPLSTQVPVADTRGRHRSRLDLFRTPLHHLSFRLFLLLFGSMALIFAAFTALIVREHRRHLMSTVSQSAGRASDVIRRATHASMLRNQRRELHEIIQNIGLQPGIDLVRIYNKQGRIMFSTLTQEVGTRVDLHADACHRCHAHDEPRQSLESGERARIIEGAEHRILGWISPIPNEPACSNSGCHAPAFEQTVLGVLDVWMSLDQVDAQLHGSSRRMLWVAGTMVLVVALAFAGWIRRLVQRPVERLIDGTRAVASGDLEHEIVVRSDDDLGDLARSFNSMTAELHRAREENRRWAETLEDKVAEKTRALRRAHAHLGQMDRMASLGKLSTTVAHEINNPLAGILTYSRLVERQLEGGRWTAEELESMRRHMRMVSAETRRCGEIAQKLLTFARTTAVQMEPTRLLALLDHCVGLVRHSAKLQGIRVEREVEGEDDTVLCAPGEIQQALLGLLVNAAEAMPHGGVLTLSVVLGRDEVRVAVRDTGVGIPSEDLPRIFEPFFTSKSETKGVGLGLSIVYGIMRRHKGSVEVRSDVDVGSTFTLVWPRHPRVDEGAADVHHVEQGGDA